MIMGDKGLAAIFASRVKPQASFEAQKKQNGDAFNEMAAEKEGDSLDEGLLASAEEIISALHSKDPKALGLALQDFIEMSQGSGSESDESSAE